MPALRVTALEQQKGVTVLTPATPYGNSQVGVIVRCALTERTSDTFSIRPIAASYMIRFVDRQALARDRAFPVNARDLASALIGLADVT